MEWAWLYLVIPFVVFVVCFISGLMYTDTYQRTVQHIHLSKPEVACGSPALSCPLSPPPSPLS
jgi:hypothetical protein